MKIFIVADVSNKSVKMFLNQMPKLAKGLIRLGHDARIFSYCDALRQISPFESKTLTSRFYKSRVDHLWDRLCLKTRGFAGTGSDGLLSSKKTGGSTSCFYLIYVL